MQRTSAFGQCAQSRSRRQLYRYIPRRPSLVAILLNPPSRTTGARSRNAVLRVASVLGHERVDVVNLCAEPTASVVELNDLRGDGWKHARKQLSSALEDAEALLAGWGVAGLSGEARRSLDAQVDWLNERARQLGIKGIWMVGGEPRHPSRWHQYVADKYARTSGGSFEQRIKQVLVSVPIRARNESYR